MLAALVPYLRDLGVSHLYLSPSFQARSGSTHGYDVIDPTRISEDRGGEDAFRALCGTAQEAGLGVLLDIVPNHMAASDENPFWRDPLWRAKFFDLDWRTGTHRRFFDVGELAGVRMEDPEVWETTHAKVVELAQEGLIDGFGSTIPTGLRIRAATWSGCARRGSSTSGSRRSSSPASGCATGPSKAPSATSS